MDGREDVPPLGQNPAGRQGGHGKTHTPKRPAALQEAPRLHETHTLRVHHDGAQKAVAQRPDDHRLLQHLRWTSSSSCSTGPTADAKKHVAAPLRQHRHTATLAGSP